MQIETLDVLVWHMRIAFIKQQIMHRYCSSAYLPGQPSPSPPPPALLLAYKWIAQCSIEAGSSFSRQLSLCLRLSLDYLRRFKTLCQVDYAIINGICGLIYSIYV